MTRTGPDVGGSAPAGSTAPSGVTVRQVTACIAGIACAALGVTPAYFMFVVTEGGGIWLPWFLAGLLVGAAISFVVFACLWTVKMSSAGRFFGGALASGIIYIAFILLTSFVMGDLDEWIMWSPILVITGPPMFAIVMGPTLFAAWFGSGLIFRFGAKDFPTADVEKPPR